jgi:neutral trehalase
MVAAIYEAEHDIAWLQAAFPPLEMEHKYWTSAPKQLRVRAAADPAAAVHQLSRYYAATELPRPEGYR